MNRLAKILKTAWIFWGRRAGPLSRSVVCTANFLRVLLVFSFATCGEARGSTNPFYGFSADGEIKIEGTAGQQVQFLPVEITCTDLEHFRISVKDGYGKPVVQFGRCGQFAYQFRSQTGNDYDIVDLGRVDFAYSQPKSDPALLLALLLLQEVGASNRLAPKEFQRFDYFNQGAYKEVSFTNVEASVDGSILKWQVFCRVNGLEENSNPLLLGELVLEYGTVVGGVIKIYDPFWANVKEKHLRRVFRVGITQFKKMTDVEGFCNPVQHRRIFVSDYRAQPSAHYDVPVGEWNRRVLNMGPTAPAGSSRNENVKAIVMVFLFLPTGCLIYWICCRFRSAASSEKTKNNK